jgi:hypothetical protein
MGSDISTTVGCRDNRYYSQTRLSPLPKSCTGISFIELIGGIAVIAIVLAILVPSPQKISAPSELADASKEVSQALRIARSTAFFNQSEISVSISEAEGASWIFFELPTLTPIDRREFQDKDLPTSVLVDDVSVRYTFNAQGEVDQQGNFILRSKYDEGLYSIIAVETTKGFVRSCFSDELREHIAGMSCEELLASEISAENCSDLNCYLISNQRKLSRAQK